MTTSAPDVGRATTTARAHGMPAETVVPLGAGLDNAAFLVDGDTVLRFRLDAGQPAEVAPELEREARLLAVVAGVSPLPVPDVRFVAPEAGCIALGLLPGRPLLALAPETRAGLTGVVAPELGALLAALHAVPVAAVDGLAEMDDSPPGSWLSEAVATYEAVTDALEPSERARVERFLTAPPPARASSLVFSHNDLGIEHVLVGTEPTRVSGVVDWSDAAVTDPACDFGLLLRDLGPRALALALDAYGSAEAQTGSLRDRAVFFARCALLEDLAYGLRTGQTAYAEKSLAALPRLFGDAAA